jgi:hypothetical protein
MQEHEEEIDASKVKQIVSQVNVWGLKSSEGWAVAQSNVYENTEVYVFWSTQQLAKLAAQEEWGKYEPAAIPLAEFLEDWCIAIFEENAMIGFDWDFKLCGLELEPLDMAQAILSDIKQNKVVIKFAKYKDVKSLSALVDKAILDNQDFG